MSLQFVVGGAGTGKSHYAYKQIIREASCHPDVLYYIVVPEQFTMQTQKTVVEMTPGKGILNIDVLSFQRLAFHVLEEVGGDTRTMLEDTGKSMVLRKLAQEHAKELPYLGSQMRRPGCLDEVKSLLSEFMQYDIGVRELEGMMERAGDRTLLSMKLKDVHTLYEAFRNFLSGSYMTSEEVMDALRDALPRSQKLRGSVILLDGFTGFTPIQVKVIRELLQLCSRMQVTVTMDAHEKVFAGARSYELFSMSRKMMRTLMQQTHDIEDSVLLEHSGNSRFCKAPELQFLEKHLFRYHRDRWEQEQKSIALFACGDPREEMEETARRIRRLVRTEGVRYGEIAVITGNLEEYGPVTRQVFDAAEIPYFIDETHNVLMNPFVEFLRSSIEMVQQSFSYESVFRYLRCSMSDLATSEIDRLENYVLALGIRGRKRWEEPWTRIYRGLHEEDLEVLNDIRARFVEETKEFAEAFSKSSDTMEAYCRALYAFIVKCRISEKLREQKARFAEQGNAAMEKEYEQIYGIVMDLLDKMVEILGEETLKRQEFLQLLETGLSEAKVALIPPSQDQILVGDMERTRLKAIKALFFVGVNEGNIPKTQSGGGILSEIDREFFADEGIELAPDSRELMNMQQFYLYLNLTKPSDRLTLSYCRANSKGEALTPASLIRRLQSMFPNLAEARPENPLDCLELPETGIQEFLARLQSKAWEKEDPVFAELYSWYLKQEAYEKEIRRLVATSFARKPKDQISAAVAKALYGEVSQENATRLEKYAACAYAHFLQYGLKLSERAEYQFRSLDFGNLVHDALEQFAMEVHKQGLSWRELTEEQQEQLIDTCLDQLAEDYGNTILKSSARQEYTIERVRRILKRTVWALQKQLKNGRFEPEGFEVRLGGGRIDRLDVLEEDDKVYVKIIDYKTGNTKFDLVLTYHGLQLQLAVYLDGAMRLEQRKHPDKEVIPAGIFYYHVDDPILEGDADELTLDEEKILKTLKMNGMVQADVSVAAAIDQTLRSIPVEITKKDGAFSKRSSVATREQFALLNRYVRHKIEVMQDEILGGNAEVSPYRRGKQTDACTYCPYRKACGFDKKIPGYEFRTLREFDKEQVWEEMQKEVE